jgi:type IV secretion system protein VirB5
MASGIHDVKHLISSAGVLMFMIKNWTLSVCSLAFLVGAPAAHAQWAVIDVNAIGQLVQQLTTLQQQLTVAREHLAEAQQEFQAITGPRGMERLLSGVVRNYLPADWDELMQVMQGASGAYSVLATRVRNMVTANAVLSEEQLAAMSAGDRKQIESMRRVAALHQALARAALESTSKRFESIQSLIDAIPSAIDQKGILDLQARIAAEQGMLQNEQTKLQVLYQTAQADDRSERQNLREQVIAGHGRFETRFHPTP